MKNKLRNYIDSTLEGNPDLVPSNCIYRKLYDKGDETLTFYTMIEKAVKEGMKSVCEIEITNGFCTDCKIKEPITGS